MAIRLGEIRLWCDRFDKDIRFDAHQLQTKISRSEVATYLLAAGRDALPVMLTHLRAPQHPWRMEPDLQAAWGWIFREIWRAVAPESPCPETLGEIDAWCAWADEVLASVRESE